MIIGGNISNCYTGGSITGDEEYGCGGFNGYNSGNNPSKCYSRSLISGVSAFNGDGGSTSTENFFDKEVARKQQSNGATGKTTAEMKTASTYTSAGWDTSIWDIKDGLYPTLQWEKQIKN